MQNEFPNPKDKNNNLFKVLFFLIPIILIISVLLVTFWLSISERIKEIEKTKLIERFVEDKEKEEEKKEERKEEEEKEKEKEIERTKIKTHVAVYFTPNQSDINFIAERFKIAIGSIEQGAFIANQLKSKSPDIIILGYRDLSLMETLADAHKDWSIVNAREDWFIHAENCEPKGPECRIKKDEHRYLMDVSNPGWQNYLANYAKDKLAKQEYAGFDGIFLDDVWPGLPWSGWLNNMHPPRNVIENWRNNTLETLRKIKNNLPRGKIVIANAGTNLEALNISDGIMNEAFIHAPWQEDRVFKSVADWKKDIDSLVYAMNNSKLYLAQSGTLGKASKAEIDKIMMFCLTSYLLGAGEKSTFSFKDYHDPGYDKIFFYSEWNTDLGTPLERYNLITGQSNVYQRKYSKGLVIVNPTNTNSSLINLDKKYKKINNEIISDIIIPAHSGVILLNL